MKITNNCRSPLGIPKIGMIEPGASKDVPESVTNNTIVTAWFDAGMLSRDSVENAGDDDAPPENDDEKAALIAQLADKGIHKTRRSSVKSLREALDDAE